MPLYDPAGNVIGTFGLSRDISARKAADAALAESERRYRELLAAIPRSLPDASVPCLNLIKDACRRLGRTISDILDLSRIETGTLVLDDRRVSVARLVRRAVEQVGFPARLKNQAIVSSVPAPAGFVACDPEKLDRAIENILGSAIKFTPEGGTIRVDVSPRWAVGTPPRADASGKSGVAGAVEISVADDGLGIAPDLLAHVGERYFRAHEHLGGIGLGLAISREFIARHGGRLAISSPPPARERGTLVALSLPLAPPPAVLVVSADAGAARRVQEHLAQYGYRVGTCPTIEVARRPPGIAAADVVLLDLGRPRPEGGAGDSPAAADGAPEALTLAALNRAEATGDRWAAVAREHAFLWIKPWPDDDLLQRVEACDSSRRRQVGRSPA